MTSQQAARRLYKSRSNRVIAGVCGGVAEYFDVDPTIVRLLWVLSVFLGGLGFILYIAAIIIVPQNPSLKPFSPSSNNTRSVWGFVLVFIGGFLLLYNLNLVPIFHWSWTAGAAILLIMAGIFLLVTHFRAGTAAPSSTSAGEEPATPPVTTHRLHRSVRDRKILGVCGGIAEYFDIDSTVVRLIFVVIALSSFGLGILAYVLLAILMPEDHLSTTSA